VDGRVLYSHVVVVEGHRMIFVAGQLARDAHGNVVGKGDMRAQLRQVGENITATLAAAGATLHDIVKTTTYVTDIDEFFRHVDVRMEYFGALPTSRSCPSTSVMGTLATRATRGGSFRPGLSCEGICWLNTPPNRRYRQRSAGQPPDGNRETVRGLSFLVKLVLCGMPPLAPPHGR
jgi:enamine deaminase RidA (YjgF/YER057c/UK114 family)